MVLLICLLLVALQLTAAEGSQQEAPAQRQVPSLVAHEWQRYKAQLCGIQVRLRENRDSMRLQ